MLIGQILLELIVILVAAQIFGYICQRLGQPRVIGEIIAGIFLGPSLLGAVLPQIKAALFPITTLPILQTLGELGLIIYMFSLGASLDKKIMSHQSRKAIFVSLSGIALPLVFGLLLGLLLYPNLAGDNATQASFALILGVVMAITAFPVLARLLHEKQMLTTGIGVLALTSAAVDDVIAWCLLSLVIAVSTAKGIYPAVGTVGLTVSFIIGMIFVVHPILLSLEKRISSNRVFLICCFILLLISSYTTNAIGIHAIFGAFLLGVILPSRSEFIRSITGLDRINTVVLLPIFFVLSGLRTQVGLINGSYLWLICLLVFVVACMGKILGGFFSSRLVGNSWKDSLGVGLLMNMRGLVGLIVLNIGLELGVLSPTIFAMLVIMALATTMMTSPLLALLGYRKGEQSLAASSQ